MKRERIDNLLVKMDFAQSLAKARALVMSGVVLANEKRVEKPSEMFLAETKIRLKGDSPAGRFVGRGGLKLEKALSEFHICANEYVCLDVGASTGGFTDCLLQNGAKTVYTIDVGTNQLDWSLRNDERVKARENVNARNLQPANFPEKFDLIVMDVSFISATKIIPALAPLLKTTGKIIVLIKPQFEVSRREVGDGGIVTDESKHVRVVAEVNSCAETCGLRVAGTTVSPISGAHGNREFLAFYELSNAPK